MAASSTNVASTCLSSNIQQCGGESEVCPIITTSAPDPPKKAATTEGALLPTIGESAFRSPTAQEMQSRELPPIRRKSTLKNLHRVVEQDPREPLLMILVKWALISLGFAMLCGVAYFMGKAVWAWISGQEN